MGKVKSPKRNPAEIVYTKTNTHHLVTCEFDGAVFENYKELKDHVTIKYGMSFYRYVLLVHDRLAEAKERISQGVTSLSFSEAGSPPIPQ
jgi:hypothetical protein